MWKLEPAAIHQLPERVIELLEQKSRSSEPTELFFSQDLRKGANAPRPKSAGLLAEYLVEYVQSINIDDWIKDCHDHDWMKTMQKV